jgi:uncharacterized protein YfaS (alpha-2-macroglobulin family)
MHYFDWTRRHAAAVVLGLAAISLCAFAASEPPSFEQSMKLFRDGNYKEAYDGLSRFVLDKDAPLSELPQALDTAIASLQQLARVDEIDAFREQAYAAHPEDWRLLSAVAQSYMNVEHYGFMIGGEFHRGQHRGGGKIMNATARDRVRALQLFQLATKHAAEKATKPELADLLMRFATAVMSGREGGASWRLQTLTDLQTLPDYEEGWGYDYGASQGAPVDAEGNPVFYALPDSFDAAKSDGERWRALLEAMVKAEPVRRNDERMTRAQFLHSQFGVQTMAEYRILLAREASDDAGDRPQTWALDTLGEDETIARLATGIKRFKLPDEHNFIKLYQLVVDDAQADARDYRIQNSAVALAHIFQDRRQYPRAAHYWREAIKRAESDVRKSYEDQLQQIVGNWGQFEGVATQPAGRGATFEFRFRNAKSVEFTANEISVRKLLDDVKAYLKSNPKQLDWQKINISEIGYRLVNENQKQYVGAEVARWTLPLEPREKHFDKRMTVTSPLQKASAYLVTAKVADGNKSNIVLWLADTAIVRKPMPDKSFYYVADAVTGAPIAKANVEFFAFRQRHIDGNRYTIDTKDSAELTDQNGQVLLPLPEDADGRHREFQWVAIATTPQGRLAYLGFHNVWRAPYFDQQYNEIKTFAITDRPVYRPGQTVDFKFWIRQAQYDMPDKSSFAHESFVVEIHNPKREKVFTDTFTSDAYGGIAGKFELPADATLGQYQLHVVNRGGGSFRVEEYKKPEFEVTVEAPKEPVMLGEKITATIRARYYFGSPVTEATVKYKVMRSEHSARWYPPGPWDWLYGPGYWWFAYDYDWYPGWRNWGCVRPSPWWYIRPLPPPEIVAEREVPIGDDGTVEVEIDTALAKEVHGDTDHRYSIQAEVVDQSRRTIVGNGEVLVARKPFEVFAWVDRGYYRAGDTITANFAARRIDGQPVEGTGKLRLLKITYGEDPERKPTENEVRSWNLNTNALGLAEIQLKASEKGQYRLSYRVTDKVGHEIEGGYLFTIIGEGFDGSEFRFNDLEIVPDKREYAPNDEVQLQINTNRRGSTVLLFLRPSNGAYQPPTLIRVAGKSTLARTGVTAKDMPNFFVEAVTIANGKVHTEVREIHVPPAKRVLKMEVVPSATEYKPGQKAKVTLKLFDDEGKPFVGSTVLSVFDKSLEYISGGTNVADIKEFFWKWRREHRPYLETNLDRWFANLVAPENDDPIGRGRGMQSIGVFGDTVADDLGSGLEQKRRGGELLGVGGGVDRFFALGKAAGAPARTPMSMSLDAAATPESSFEAPASATPPAPTQPLVEPTVRSVFADTAFWAASLETNSDGLAEVEFDMPENLTSWRVRAWAMGHGTRVGEASAEVVTRKNLIVRMQAPRFFVETDEVMLSANVHSYLPTAKQVTVKLELEGSTIELPSAAENTIEIPAGGERRVDWRVKAVREGEAVLRMSALTDEESDAVQMKFPVFVHGMLKMDSYSGSLRPADEKGEFEINVPSKRRAEDTRLEVRYSPTLAGAMVDALPYLVDYPYGCTEQTLNRFLPAVITQQTLLKMGLDLKAIRDKRTNLNAQELDLPPGSPPSPFRGGDGGGARAEGWKRYDRNPVFDEAELSKIVKAGVNRLTEMQLSDGGWGWFSGWGEQSTPHTTALVVHGLQVAQHNDVAIVPGVVERGIEWLKQYQEEQLRALANVDDKGNVIDKSKPAKHDADNIDALVYMVLADSDVKSDAMRDHLYNDRTKLAAYGLALYGLGLHKQQEADKLAMVMRNISQYVVEDDENQTAYLRLPENIWWYWYGSEYEAHAYYLKLLVATDPKSEIAPRLVKYLVNNRKHATYWNSTRDTALVVEAFADYIKATGEDKPDLTVEVWVDGEKRKEVKINTENLFAFDNAFVLEGDALAAGAHKIELRKTGTGPLYWNGYLTNFTLEDDIRSAGLELKVNRHYYKLSPAEKSIDVAGSRGQVVGQRAEKYDRTEIENLGSVESGDLIEIELIVESKNDYEYILLEDMKAAGCEPVAVQSGYNGNELGAYMELRDNRVALFVRQLARGKHSVSYRMRAEIPGQFSALPTKASAMYAPELKGNSNEFKLRIEDAPAGEVAQNP